MHSLREDSGTLVSVSVVCYTAAVEMLYGVGFCSRDSPASTVWESVDVHTVLQECAYGDGLRYLVSHRPISEVE